MYPISRRIEKALEPGRWIALQSFSRLVGHGRSRTIGSPVSRLQRMRNTKIALLTFGFGVVLGLVVIAGDVKRLERAASGLMAFGIAIIPIAMIMDWRRMAKSAKSVPRRRAKAPAARAPSRVRRSARQKR
jgi:hypothetical protein